MSLRARLVLLVVGLVALLLGALGAGVVMSVERWATEVVDDELARRADVVGHEVELHDGVLHLDEDDDLGHRGLPFRIETDGGRVLLTSELPFPPVEPRGLGLATLETARGERLRVLSLAFQPRHSDERLVLRVAAPLAVVSRIAGRVKLRVYVMLLLATLLGAAGAAAVAHGVLAPMRRLSSQVEALEAGDAAARVDPRGLGPELGGLATAFNGLLERLGAALAAQRAFVGRASHALRTPLASILMEAEVALRKERDAAASRATLEAIAATTREATALADGLLALTRADAAPPAPRERVALAALAAELRRLFERRCAAKPLAFTVEVPEGLALWATRGRLREMLDALLDNAVRYTPAGGRVTLTARGEGDDVVFEVCDSGPGFAPGEAAQALERFFRGRAAAQAGAPGSGLGLSVVKALAAAEGAVLTLGDAEGGGALVSLRYPAGARDDAAPARQP